MSYMIGASSIIGSVALVLAVIHYASLERKRRDEAVENKVKEMGGRVVAIEKIDRLSCPFSEAYEEPGVVFRFYRIRYDLGDRRKLGYGVLKIQQKAFGPGLAGDTSWIWRM